MWWFLSGAGNKEKDRANLEKKDIEAFKTKNMQERKSTMLCNVFLREKIWMHHNNVTICCFAPVYNEEGGKTPAKKDGGDL